MKKGSSKKPFPQGPKSSPSVSINATKGTLKGSGGDTGRATPPQVNKHSKPKGNP